MSIVTFNKKKTVRQWGRQKELEQAINLTKNL